MTPHSLSLIFSLPSFFLPRLRHLSIVDTYKPYICVQPLDSPKNQTFQLSRTMGKGKEGSNKASSKELKQKSPNASASISTQHLATTTSAIKVDPDLGYRIRVLIHDFLNVTKDPNASRRINSTTDEHYISAPYFNDTQSALLRHAIVDSDLGTVLRGMEGYEDTEEANAYESILQSQRGQTFDTALRSLLSNFIDKRRASGDARPCGPHHLGPMYASLFGIEMEELNDDRFLTRLRRSGV